MVETWRNKIAAFIAPEYIAEARNRLHAAKILEAVAETNLKDMDNEVGKRVAVTLSRMDLWEPVMKEFGGVFTADFEHVEEPLDARSKLLMMQLGYQLRDDPSFNRLVDWMVNTQGNNAVKLGNPTPETILFSRAMIAAPLTLRKEIRRLALLYDGVLESQKVEPFDETLSTE